MRYASIVHMFVLGVDPGLSRCGYALLQPLKRGRAKLCSLGLIRTPKELPTSERLAILKSDFRELLQELKPDVVAIERVFFYKNLNTAIGVIQACGVLQAEAVSLGASVTEYSPTDVKAAITGDGQADKQQVQFMVKTLLSLEKEPKPADAADAVAMALCHLAYNPKQTKLEVLS